MSVSRHAWSAVVWLASLVGVGGCALQYVVPGDDTCATSTTGCDDTCATSTDPAACDASTTACVGDDCPPVCTFTDCDGQCVDPMVDPANCGDCGRECGGGQNCIAGECVDVCGETCDGDSELCVEGDCVCRSGLERCDGECVDVSSDDKHCGMCNRDCDDMFCLAGECVASCGDATLCDESCVDLMSDPLNCGVCERACHPSQSCVDAICTSPAPS